MLRSLVLALGAVMTAGGAALTATGQPGAAPLLVFGALLLIGTLFERVVYKRLARRAPPARFMRTAERFRDPGTGEPVTVYADSATGERAYVRE